MDELPPLERDCADCGGNGKIDGRREGGAIHFGGPCNTCRGVGKVPTVAGLQVVALMRNQRRMGDF